MRTARLLLLAVVAALAAANNDFYELLGITKDANEESVKKAYRKLSRKLHPGACAPTAVARRPSKARGRSG